MEQNTTYITRYAYRFALLCFVMIYHCLIVPILFRVTTLVVVQFPVMISNPCQTETQPTLTIKTACAAPVCANTLRPRQDSRHFPGDIFNAFSRMKKYEFRLRFHWILFLRFELTIFQHWFRQWLSADQAKSHYLNQWWLVYWQIFASLDLNELNVIAFVT